MLQKKLLQITWKKSLHARLLLMKIYTTFTKKSSSKMFSGSSRSSASSKAATISGSRSGRGPTKSNANNNNYYHSIILVRRPFLSKKDSLSWATGRCSHSFSLPKNTGKWNDTNANDLAKSWRSLRDSTKYIQRFQAFALGLWNSFNINVFQNLPWYNKMY